MLMLLHVQVQMEMLQMDLEDTETAMTSFDGQLEELKGTIALLESQKTDLEVSLEDSQAQVRHPMIWDLNVTLPAYLKPFYCIACE